MFYRLYKLLVIFDLNFTLGIGYLTFKQYSERILFLLCFMFVLHLGLTFIETVFWKTDKFGVFEEFFWKIGLGISFICVMILAIGGFLKNEITLIVNFVILILLKLVVNIHGQFNTENKLKMKSLNLSDDQECSICLDVQNKDWFIQLDCQHIFHKNCIERWIVQKNNCPLCRADV